jgi:protein-arginine kinase activator protein McsA
MNTSILVSPDVLKQAGVKEDTIKDVKKLSKKPDLSLKVLKEKLKTAIEEEEYEIAAKLRDKISNLES